jgi:hypothetical protein
MYGLPSFVKSQNYSPRILHATTLIVRHFQSSLSPRTHSSALKRNLYLTRFYYHRNVNEKYINLLKRNGKYMYHLLLTISNAESCIYGFCMFLSVNRDFLLKDC